MAVRFELSADKDRGPGHGVLRIEGLPELSPPIDLAIERNQGGERFLRAGGNWQASKAWLRADEVAPEDEAYVVRVGPEIVDAIVDQPPSVAYRLTVATATSRGQSAVMTVSRGLLGSRAAAPAETDADAARREEEHRRHEAEAEERRSREAEAERLRQSEESAEAPVASPPPRPDSRPEPPTSSRWPLIGAAAAVLLIAGAAAGAWYGCLVPGFGSPSCAAPAATETAAAPAPANPPPASSPDLTCTGITPDACYQLGQSALAAGELERGRQLCQRAAMLGSVEANLCVARMYDPATWTQAKSPAPRADWETATYWYEAAAKLGNAAGLAGAGRLLCEDATTDFERTRGLGYLRQALQKTQDPALQQQAAACEAKIQK